jgi:hypothetical protein
MLTAAARWPAGPADLKLALPRARAVGPIQPGPWVGAAKHGDLVAQHEQLGVLGRRRATEQDQPAEDPDEYQVEEAKGHRRS